MVNSDDPSEFLRTKKPPMGFLQNCNRRRDEQQKQDKQGIRNTLWQQQLIQMTLAIS